MKNSLFDKALKVSGPWDAGLRSCQRHLTLLVLTWFLPVLHAAAQATSDTPEMADAMRGSGKIYVVVAVVAVVLAGLLAFLVSLDRKVSRLERELKD